MGRKHHPRRGSLAYAPRKRAKRIYPRVRTRLHSKDIKIQEFAGYKVGMTHISIINDVKGSTTYNQEIVVPVTIIETPPLKVCGIRAYKEEEGILKVSKDVLAENLDKNLERKINISKKKKSGLEDLDKNIDKYDSIHLIVHTQPNIAGIHKKKPELFEIEISGESIQEKLNLAKEKLGKEISIRDIFKPGEVIDTIAVTKGKGFQGSVKRFGVKLLSHKSQKSRRKAGNLGPWHPAKTQWTVPQKGQMGFHTRTEYNKRILFLGEKAEEINKSGWKFYGLVKNQYILLKGSVQGPPKRLIRMRSALRSKNNYGEPVIGEVVVK